MKNLSLKRKKKRESALANKHLFDPLSDIFESCCSSKTSYLKGRLVVPDSILQDENVAEQLVAIHFLDFDGWCDIDDSGAFFHQTMIAISVSDERDA